MLKTLTKVASISLLIATAACGGGGGSSTPVEGNTQSARSTIDSSVDMKTSFSSTGGQSVSASLNAMGASAQTIVQPKAQGVGFAPIDKVLEHISTAPLSTFAPGDCNCTETECVFDECGGGGYTMSGSIQKSGDTYTIDVSMKLVSSGIDYSWNYDGVITISDTLIDGDLSGDGSGTFSGQGQSVTYDIEWDISYNSVALDGAGCPVGGTLDASIDYDIGGVQGAGAANYEGDVTITFGPSCGAATAN